MPHKDPSEHRPHAHVHKPHVHLHKPKISKPKIKKIPKLARRGPTLGRRFIEDLRGKYRGKEIWILGTGPSMDDYPDDFFDDKISIGLKSNLVIFPNCTFHMGSIGWPLHRGILIKDLDLLKKHIFTLRTRKPRHRDWVPKEYHKLPIYIWVYRINIKHGDNKKYFTQSIDRIMKKQLSRYPYEDTISHPAIQAAAILGAKKITLAGCQEKCIDGRFFAERYRGMHYSSKKFNYSEEEVKMKWKGGWRQRKANRVLANALKRYGIEMTLYHYKDSEQYKAGYLRMI